MGKSKILVVEDEFSIQKMLEYDLKNAGFDVDIASTGNEGYIKALENEYDVILLDLMLPGMDGILVCEKLRENNIDTYIIMLTAMSDEYYKIKGLNQGADDYVTKPFSPKEVVARINATLRRKEIKAKNEIIKYRNIEIDTKKYLVLKDGEKIELTLKEYELLTFLVKNVGKVLSRDILLNKLWGYSYDGDTRVVDVHIFKIREKTSLDQYALKTVRGVGYMLVEE